MRIFLTGATGFVGSAIARELIEQGHRVLGLARSNAAANALAAAGVEVQRGSMEDLASLKRGAADADGVIHTAFNHDFTQYVANCEADRHAIEALGAALARSNRPLIVTSGTGMALGTAGHSATENDAATHSPRAASEDVAASVAANGVKVSVVRLPQVHDTTKQGLVSYAIAVAREKKHFAYLGDGQNRWPAVHVLDAARLYRLAIEKSEDHATYHAVAEEGIPLREIGEAVGRCLDIPVVSIAREDAESYFGPLAAFAGLDAPATSDLTRARLGWKPTGPGLIADLERLSLPD